MISITAVIPTLDRPICVNNLLLSLYNQTYEDFNIIIIDQGDLNPTNCPALNKFPANRIKHIKKEYKHAPRARNEGVMLAETEYVLILDDDIEIHRNFIQVHLEHISDPQIFAVQGAVIQPGKKFDFLIPFTFYLPYIGFAHFPLHYKEVMDNICNLPSGNMSIRKKDFLRCGGFDEQIEFDRHVDTDFVLRAYKFANLDKRIIRHVPDAVIYHLMSNEGRTRVWNDKNILRKTVGNNRQWDMTFYFIRKNFGLQKGYREILVLLRLLVLRKEYLLHPKQLITAIHEMVIGFKNSSKRLKQGPFYITKVKQEKYNRSKYFWMNSDQATYAKKKNYGGLKYTFLRMVKPGIDFEKHAQNSN